jgi:hypothetical protein
MHNPSKKEREDYPRLDAYVATKIPVFFLPTALNDMRRLYMGLFVQIFYCGLFLFDSVLVDSFIVGIIIILIIDAVCLALGNIAIIV